MYFDPAQDEKAVVMGNRLPSPGSNAVAFLVSVENNYPGTDGTAAFAGVTNTAGNFLLPILYQWQFHADGDNMYCVTDGVYDKVENSVNALQPKPSAADIAQMKNSLGSVAVKDVLFQDTTSFLNNSGIKKISSSILPIVEKVAKLPDVTFNGLLSNLKGGFAALSSGKVAYNIQKSGSFVLPYAEESAGDFSNTSAWYRSPLAAAPIDLSGIDPNFPLITENPGPSQTISTPTKADELLINDSNEPKFVDGTYAAAYELGRLTALSDVDFSTEFFKWKNATAAALRMQALKSQAGYPNVDHLTIIEPSTPPTLPKTVADKFDSWKQLESILIVIWCLIHPFYQMRVYVIFIWIIIGSTPLFVELFPLVILLM